MIDLVILNQATTVPYPFEPWRWYHAILSVIKDQIILMVDGKQLLNRTIEMRSGILMNGVLILGQEQDDLKNDFFSKTQMLQGTIHGLMFLIGSPLHFKSDNTNCVIIKAEANTFIRWETIGFKLSGKVTRQVYKPCRQVKEHLYIIPDKNDYISGKESCSVLNLQLYSPKDHDTNNLVTKLLKSVKSCFFAQFPGLHNVGWVDLTYMKNARSWSFSDGTVLDHRNSSYKIENNLYHNLHMAMTDENIFTPIDDSQEICSICSKSIWTKAYYFSEICKEDTERNLMSFFMRNSKDGLIFYNHYGFSIKSQNSVWHLVHSSSNRSLGQYDGHFSIGRKSWKLFYESIDCNTFLKTFSQQLLYDIGKDRQAFLSFSDCSHEEYTCDDGSCIPMVKICDQRLDCPDNSDEYQCSPLDIPKAYESSIPPSNYPFVLKVSFNIEKVRPNYRFS